MILRRDGSCSPALRLHVASPFFAWVTDARSALVPGSRFQSAHDP